MGQSLLAAPSLYPAPGIMSGLLKADNEKRAYPKISPSILQVINLIRFIRTNESRQNPDDEEVPDC